MNSNAGCYQYKKQLTQLQATLSLEELEWPCEIIDISLHGCLLRFKNTWEQQNLETIYTLTVPVPGSTEIIINLSIAHVIDNEAGFKCEHINNSSLLRKLVTPGSYTNKLLARELNELTYST